MFTEFDLKKTIVFLYNNIYNYLFITLICVAVSYYFANQNKSSTLHLNTNLSIDQKAYFNSASTIDSNALILFSLGSNTNQLNLDKLGRTIVINENNLINIIENSIRFRSILSQNFKGFTSVTVDKKKIVDNLNLNFVFSESDLDIEDLINQLNIYINDFIKDFNVAKYKTYQNLVYLTLANIEQSSLPADVFNLDEIENDDDILTLDETDDERLSNNIEFLKQRYLLSSTLRNKSMVLSIDLVKKNTENYFNFLDQNNNFIHLDLNTFTIHESYLFNTIILFGLIIGLLVSTIVSFFISVVLQEKNDKKN